MLKNDFGLIFWIHLLVILAYFASPFILGWQWILLVIALFYLQHAIFKNCILTNAQFQDREDVAESERSFYAYYFRKMGVKINSLWVKKYFASVLVWSVIVVALLWQLGLHKPPQLVSNLF